MLRLLRRHRNGGEKRLEQSTVGYERMEDNCHLGGSKMAPVLQDAKVVTRVSGVQKCYDSHTEDEDQLNAKHELSEQKLRRCVSGFRVEDDISVLPGTGCSVCDFGP